MFEYRKLSLFFLLLCAAFVISGCGRKQKYSDAQMAAMPLPERDGLPAPDGGFTIRVAGDVIKAEEVVGRTYSRLSPAAAKMSEAQFKSQARGFLEQFVESKIVDILLYTEARKAAPESINEAIDKAVKQEVQRFISSFDGNLAKAEAALQLEGYDWQSFRDYKKRVILVQSYLSQKMPEDEPITYSELVAKYDQLKQEKYTQEQKLHFSLIDIQVDKVVPADANVLPDIYAKEAAAELVERLRKGAGFDEIAKEYSHGPRAAVGGEWNPVNADSLARPYDILAAESEKMEIGQISDPIEKDGHLFVMKLLGKPSTKVTSMQEVQSELEAMIKLERRSSVMERLSDEIVSKANIASKDMFIDYCLDRIYKLSNS